MPAALQYNIKRRHSHGVWFSRHRLAQRATIPGHISWHPLQLRRFSTTAMHRTEILDAITTTRGIIAYTDRDTGARYACSGLSSRGAGSPVPVPAVAGCSHLSPTWSLRLYPTSSRWHQEVSNLAPHLGQLDVGGFCRESIVRVWLRCWDVLDCGPLRIVVSMSFLERGVTIHVRKRTPVELEDGFFEFLNMYY